MYVLYIYYTHLEERKRIEKTDERDQRALHNIYNMYSHVEVPIYSTRGQVFASDRIIGAYRYFYIRD